MKLLAPLALLFLSNSLASQNIIFPNEIAYPQLETCNQFFNRNNHIPRFGINEKNFDDHVKDAQEYEKQLLQVKFEVLSFLSGINSYEIFNGKNGKNILEEVFGEHAWYLINQCRNNLNIDGGNAYTADILIFHYQNNLEKLNNNE